MPVMCSANIFFLATLTLSNARWFPPGPGLRGDLPPWGPALPPIPPPWSAPPPSDVFRRPMDAMVDLTNDLSIAILQDYSHVRSNFAFSPYGLASVLVVLYEGTMGESARQIHMAAKFPWDRDITRIGFRDIHRHLRSYFSHEGYLSGISMNKNKSTLKPEYKRVLRFYGYDVDVEPLRPSTTPATFPKRPMVQVPFIQTSKKPGARPSTPKPTLPATGKESEDYTEQSIILNMPEDVTTLKTPLQNATVTTTSKLSSLSTPSEVITTSPPSVRQPDVTSTLPPRVTTTEATTPATQTTVGTASPATSTEATSLPSGKSTVSSVVTETAAPLLAPQSSEAPLVPTTNQDAGTSTTHPAAATEVEDLESRLGDIAIESTQALPAEAISTFSPTLSSTLSEETTMEFTTTDKEPEQETTKNQQFDTTTTSAEDGSVTTTPVTSISTDFTTTSEEGTTVNIGDNSENKDIIKRSQLLDIRTLDEYFLGGEVTKKAPVPPVQDLMVKQTEELIPRTLDEFMLKTKETAEDSEPVDKSVIKRSPQWSIRTLDEYFLGSDLSKRGLTPPLRDIIVQKPEDLYPRTLDEFMLLAPKYRKSPVAVSNQHNYKPVNVSPAWDIRTIDEYFLGSDLAKKGLTPPIHQLTVNPTEDLYPRTLDELLLMKQAKQPEQVYQPQTLDEYFIYRQGREQEPASPIQYKTELAFKRFSTKRKSRTITDMLHLPGVPDLSLQLQNGMFDSHVSRKAELYRPLPRQAFLVDASAETPVPVMTYNNVFPYAYIPRLHSTALEFPLDDERYKLLIILPNERRGLRQLTYDLGEVTLRGVLNQLKPARVKATVPTFMVEGFVILTPALQRLGIWNVFDPRRANLSSMSSDPELYVRNVEQSVTVVIRNYVEILDIQTRTMAARSVEHEFVATHPFLYFVLDTETNVALMAGQMLDPLNSRVY